VVSGTLLSLLDEFKDVILGNNAVGKKAVYGVQLFLISFQGGVWFENISVRTTEPSGVEKHHAAADVLEARRAEGECGESACIDAGDFLEVDYDFLAPRVQ
jgi:hypothetical protein